MRRFILLLSLFTAALCPAPSSAQQRNQLGLLCTTDTTPADQQIDACNKIIALKVLSGEKLATIYFWRAVGWNKKGNYAEVIADASEAIRLAPNVPSYNLRGSASQVAIVYYAGHGVQIDGRNYLVPADAQLKPGGNLTDTMMDMDTIMAGLDDQLRTNILILDACRNNPMAPQVASADVGRAIEGGGLAAPSSLGSGSTLGAGTLIAFATAPGKVALDGEGANSPFSAALSRHIGTPGLDVQQMLTRVRAEVVAATKSQQVPWSNSSLLGEVYLAEKP